MIEKINTQMIILAREARGMSQMDLAKKIGMTATNLSKIERNEIGVSPAIVEQISLATYFPVQFFMHPGNILPDSLSYRRKDKVPQKILVPINSTINIIKNHVELLCKGLHIQKAELPSMGKLKDPVAIAARLRMEWNVKDGPVESMVKLMEQQGIIISTFDFDTFRVDSRTLLTSYKVPVVFINKALSGDRQRFSLAYELGQLIMHTFTSVHPERNVAHEANLFAASFLMPEETIKADLAKGVTIPLLASLKKKWKVSMISLLYRADDLGLLTANQKRYLLQQFNQLKIRRCEPPELDVAREIPQQLRRLIAEYRSKTKLTTGGMAAVFALNVDEFVKMYG